ncbi:transposase [Streptomyces sp. NPDC048664]|uniref:IS110 family transposase n=1 Tax=Streptomyces sp. NPDC048664 TaxID=3154505 RepID=UPI003428EC85
MPTSAGFDIAKDFPWMAVLNDRGQPTLGHRVDNDPASMDAAADELLVVPDRYGDVIVGLDVMGGIADMLTAMPLSRGLCCVHMSGLTENRARHRTRGRGNKFDARDARVITEQVVCGADVWPVPLSREDDAPSRLLVDHRVALVEEITAHTNRLHDLLADLEAEIGQLVDARCSRRAKGADRELRDVFNPSAF